MKKGYLVLANGDIYEGERFGADKDALGELVFTTGTPGYTETVTDPSYYGQIVTQTFPLIGNYGVDPADAEGAPALFGYVAREICGSPSNFRSKLTLEEFLISHGVPGLCGVDTRQITKTIRGCGVMNAAICSEVPSDLDTIKAFSVKDAVRSVSSDKTEIIRPGEYSHTVVLIDYGAKKSIADSLVSRGCRVIKVPYDSRAEYVLSFSPDGVVLSNGPGDPAENVYCIKEIAKLTGKLPIFGICLGHQLLSLALGAKTEKLKFGHRGANQPVKDLVSGRTYITSQNHGYAVVADSLPDIGRLRFVNANDGSCEGIDYPEIGCSSVQFHPEAHSGPRDTGFLFDDFVKKLGG